MDPYNKKSREYPWSYKADIDIAMRGSISSLDDYVLASSKKLYAVGIYVPSIYEEKRELLINLLNLYANFDKKNIRNTMQRGGNVVIADNINAIDAFSIYLSPIF